VKLRNKDSRCEKSEFRKHVNTNLKTECTQRHKHPIAISLKTRNKVVVFWGQETVSPKGRQMREERESHPRLRPTKWCCNKGRTQTQIRYGLLLKRESKTQACDILSLVSDCRDWKTLCECDFKTPRPGVTMSEATVCITHPCRSQTPCARQKHTPLVQFACTTHENNTGSYLVVSRR
jgi:hypothetical protein